jgi:hypothetical protein
LVSDWFIHNGPVENGTIVASARVKVKVKVKVNFYPMFGIAFGEGGDASGESMDKFILNTEQAVESVFGELTRFIQ